MRGALALERAGASVHTQARVARVEDGGVELADGRSFEADAIIVATQAAECAALLGEEGPTLEDSPIVSVHLWFDRTIMEPSLAALLDSPAHWVFDRGRLTNHPPERGPVSNGCLERRA